MLRLSALPSLGSVAPCLMGVASHIINRAAKAMPPHHYHCLCSEAAAGSTPAPTRTAAGEEVESEPVDLRTTSDRELSAMFKGDTRSALTQVDISVLGTGANELSPSFVLNTTSRNYLFNLGEGWRRMAECYNLPIKSPLTLFTRACWENAGGSCNIYHKFSDYMEMQEYCGPPKMSQYMHFMRKITGKSTWRRVMTREEEGEPGYFEDQNMRVRVVPLAGGGSPESVVAYSCKLRDWLGNLAVERAVELGVRKGPAYKVLLSGRSVITEEGKVVRPPQVMTGARSGPTFLVVDCPTEEVMGALTTHPHLQGDWYGRHEEGVKLIVHITPLHLLQEQAYCEWVSGFGSDTKHLLLHASLCPGEVGYRSAMSFSLPFHLMNPSVYRLPQLPHKNQLHKHNLNICKHLKEDSVLFGRMLMKYHLKPSPSVDYSSCLSPVEEHLERDLSVIMENKQLSKNITSHRNFICQNSHFDHNTVLSSLTEGGSPLSSLTHRDDLQVTFLGTASAYPTRFRSESGILLQTLTDGHILLDCGEGTLSRIYSCFGRGPAQEILRNLKAIFVSHMHPDHHLGVVSILEEVSSLGSSNVVQLLCHQDYANFLKTFHVICHPLSYETVDLKEGAGGLLLPPDITFQAVPVDHIRNSYGVVLHRGGARGWSLVYSGDTMPCRALVREGHGATLLIHEATLNDDRKAEALQKKHSTFGQAVKVSQDMRAEFTVVTHFSARYVMAPLAHYRWPENVVPAVDLMTFRLSDVWNQKLNSASSRRVCLNVSRSFNYENRDLS